MDQAVLAAQVGRIEEVAESLRLKSNHDPYADDLEELADELQDIAETIHKEVE